ncbi:hypothetical protein VMCG_02405 [Cytospora schulzeri]|uniref:Uncharacterized protein n=1 Tax=Cytospora schulzeri TaxID=448051 RepID=A0A423X158_9PEZI|nr:hypothetical protein VMCG_02405 [Valsa malicola]
MDTKQKQFTTNLFGHALLLEDLTPHLIDRYWFRGRRPCGKLSFRGYEIVTVKTIQFDAFKDPEQILNTELASTTIQRHCQSRLANLYYAREAAKHLQQR